MTAPPLAQHQREIQRNLTAWRRKPLLRAIYGGFYDRILELIDPCAPGRIVEIGSGIGNLKARLPQALATDLFVNPWLDLVGDGYELPFVDASLSHLVLFDVFHHLQAPNAFLKEARRVLRAGGRLILCEPYVSLCSFAAYGLFHHEPVGWRAPIDLADRLRPPRAYYAAQGNATRLFFHRERPGWPPGWEVFHARAYASFSYLLSGGFSRRALYPACCLPCTQWLDRVISRWPTLFAARCVVGLRRLAG